MNTKLRVMAVILAIFSIVLFIQLASRGGRRGMTRQEEAKPVIVSKVPNTNAAAGR
jgi:hypothetical protein